MVTISTIETSHYIQYLAAETKIIETIKRDYVWKVLANGSKERYRNGMGRYGTV